MITLGELKSRLALFEIPDSSKVWVSHPDADEEFLVTEIHPEPTCDPDDEWVVRIYVDDADLMCRRSSTPIES